jgi:hypothetical protein
MTDRHGVTRYNPKVGLHYLLAAFLLCVQMGALAQAPTQVTITLVRWPFT